jgi:hypothetical protein
MEAEKIEAETSKTLQEEKLVRDAALEKARVENETKRKIYQNE